MSDDANETKKDAPKWDWVTGRSSCSYPKIFKTLLSEVEEDVKTRNGLRPNNSPYEFSVLEKSEEFTVVLQAKDLRKSVTFGLGERSISVRDEQDQRLFDVTLSFTQDGKCRLNVKDEEYELWQVRRMALEPLFFAGY